MKDQIMPPKSPRGIQSEDVVQAADALIAEGLRPTIERVRQKIGRGSPNTVGPLLDLRCDSIHATSAMKPMLENIVNEHGAFTHALSWVFSRQEFFDTAFRVA